MSTQPYNIPPILTTCSGLDSTTEDMLLDAYSDIGKFGKLFFPEIFRTDYTALHQKLIDFINECYAEQREKYYKHILCGIKAVVIGTRGLAKSSFLQVAVPARALIMQDCHFYVAITKSLGNTLLWTENFKRSLLRSKAIMELIGSIKDPSDAMKESFGKECWTASNDTHQMLVLPRGRGQEVRGLNFDGHRPDLLVLDDLEDKKEIRNPERRKEVKDYIDTDVLKCVNLLESENTPWAVFACDTVKGHPDVAVEYLAKQPDWKTLRVSVCDENFKVLDERFMSQATLDSEVATARTKGTLHLLSQELMGRPGVNEYAPFKASDRRYFIEEAENLYANPNITTCVMVDPARSKHAKSDDTGFAVGSVDVVLPRIYAREVYAAKLDQNEIVDTAIDLALKYDATAIGVELTGVGFWCKQMFMDGLQARGLYHIQLIDLKDRAGRGEDLSGDEGAKVARGLPMVAYYRWNLVYHSNHPSMAILEQAQNEFPDCCEWHIPDAWHYMLQMMQELGLTFLEKRFENVGQANQAISTTEFFSNPDRVYQGDIRKMLKSTQDSEPIFIPDTFSDPLTMEDFLL